MTGRPVAVAALLLLAGVAAGCGGKGGGASSGQTLEVTLTDSGCAPATLRARSGRVTFEVSNGGTSKVSEFELKDRHGVILGERENIVGGITGSFTLTLQPGRYVLSCPNGAGDDQGVLIVSGERVAARSLPRAELAAAVAAYRAYIGRQSDQLLAGVRRLAAALEAGDLDRAKSLYGPVRAHYEAIEPVAESFGDLDPRIDARAGDLAEGVEWTGFHRIEQILWTRGTTAGTGPLARKLVADVATLARKVRALRFQAAQLANGAVELLDEVAHSKITGEEDRYSHTDLSDFQANLAGSREAFDLLRPALEKEGAGDLVKTIDRRFDAVQAGLDRYRRPTSLGFALYGELTAADRRTLAQQLDALAEPLSTVAARVSG
jgi:iron uptake system component EfeO